MLHTGKDANRALKGGAAGGIFGGVVLSLVLVGTAALNGRDAWGMMKGAGAPFLHERAMAPGFDAVAVVVGLICHFGISILWGVGFGLVAFGLSRVATLWFGVLWGFIAWIVMHYVVLPLVGLGAMAAATPGLHAALLHVVFGIFVALGFMPYQEPRFHRLHHAT